ncbi:PQQ-binding-like beta-propeller repeat protein [Streptomyces tritici]|uniref:outer membrane protein assembly factor BamB family protein n=1 Tax=Streptomyces tritici TaxID=2054410 RepID=UPI003AF0D2D5
MGDRLSPTLCGVRTSGPRVGIRVGRMGGGSRDVVRGVTAIGVVIAVVLGVAWAFLGPSGYWPGAAMVSAWEARSDSEAPEGSVHRAWLVGDTVVRARYDGVVGFDAGSGKEVWEFVPPRRGDVCAAGEAADGGRVLVAYTLTVGGRCDVVAAIDLGDGRELWHAALPLAGDGALAVGGGLGVVVVAGGGNEGPSLRAFDLRTGAARWTAAVPKGCAPGRAAVAPEQVVAVLACGGEVKLAGFSPRDGRARWTTPLDARNGVAADASVSITATDPIVLRVDEGDRGIDGFLAFGSDGRPGARIRTTDDGYGTISPEVAVDGNRLFALTNGGPWGRLVAFDLTSGDELWQDDGIGGAAYVVQGLHAEDGRVMAMKGSARYGDHLYVFDAATGDEEEDRAFRDKAGSVDELLPYKDRIIAVRSGGNTKPFSVYERW